MGTIKVDVHYYEDGNVRLLTTKPVQASLTSGSAAEIVKSNAALDEIDVDMRINPGTMY